MQVSTGTFGTLTKAFISIIDSFGTLLENETIPFEIVSSAARMHCIEEYCYLSTMKQSFPTALELWSLPLTVTTFPSSELSISQTFVNTFVNLSSGSPCDLLSSLSPNKWALGSFVLLFSSAYFATFVCLYANLSAFLDSRVSPFSSSCLISGISPSSSSSSENTCHLGYSKLFQSSIFMETEWVLSPKLKLIFSCLFILLSTQTGIPKSLPKGGTAPGRQPVVV